MERRQIGLKLAMDGLNLPVTVETFDDRLILQKALYLAQAAGVHLGYYFRWYLRGPYCPAVAEDGYTVNAELSQNVDDAKGWTLDEASTQTLKRIQGMVSSKSRPGLAKKLELLASVHFLMERRPVRRYDPKKIAQTLREFDKPFTDEEVSSAIKELRENGLLP